MAREITFLNGIASSAPSGVTNIKCASHPRTMFFYGFRRHRKADGHSPRVRERTRPGSFWSSR